MIDKKIKTLCLSVRIVTAKTDPFDTESYSIVHEVKNNCGLFNRKPVIINADPFLFVHNDYIYLFYEEQVLGQNGVIKMARSQNLIDWDEPQTVLREDFHLSYPNVFSYNDNIYMMPETGGNKSIRLYKANEDLSQWALYEELMQGEGFVDSSIYVKDGICYLFTTVKQNNTYTLKLFYANNLFSSWKEHPSSPIYIGDDYGRCGGPIFEYDGKIYRPAQKCDKWYGEKLVLFEIMECSEQSYKEVMVKDNVIPIKDKFFKNGGHHFNHAIFNEKDVVVMDGVQFKFNVWGLIQKLIKKL